MTVVYKPNEIMKKFGLKESLYKKYITALEKEGYIFQKNQQGHRIFSDEDIEILEKFLELIRYDGMTIDSVAKKIGKMKGHDGMTEQIQDSHDVMTLVEKTVTVALEAQEKQLIAKFQTQFQQTQEQLNRIETRANERDKLLMQSIRESQEVKKLLLEVKEQVAAAQEEEKKKGFFARLFGK
jgi:DNA-binding transcriptional MerR regulator